MEDSTVEIFLRSRKYFNLVAVINAVDIDVVSQYKWNVHKTARGILYAISSDSMHHLMHRLIMKAEGRVVQVDHIDGNGLNNTRINLRLVNNSQNQMNSKKRSGTKSKYKGVSWNSRDKNWRAMISINGKLKSLGSFASELDAAFAYDGAAVVHYGVYANLNFPNIHR